MIRKGWSYKEDRRLSELAGSGKTLEQIAKAMDRTPGGIRSIRLGVSIKSKAATRKIVAACHIVAEPEQAGAGSRTRSRPASRPGGFFLFRALSAQAVRRSGEIS